jgi:hypothetical protein
LEDFLLKDDAKSVTVPVQDHLEKGTTMDHDCECLRMTSMDVRAEILTRHHENCPKNPGALAAVQALLTELVRGIERWGREEDGIPGDLWGPYAQAKTLIGESVPEI